MKLIQTNNFKIAINDFGDPIAQKLCILMPGRLDTKDYVNFVSHGKFLASLGYYVIAMDPPYSWDSPGDLDNYSTTNYIQSIHELIEYFSDRQTLLIGHSRGGATAMLASTKPKVEAIVLINAAYGPPTPPDPTQLVDGSLFESRDISPGDKKTKNQKLFLLPMSYFQDGAKYNPIDALRKFSGAKFIIHATQDEFCDLKEVHDIYESIIDPKMFLKIDCSHDYRLFPEVINTINQHLAIFIKEKINN